MYVKKSLKFNVIARSAVGFAELLFSLFCFPYVAKKLDPTGLGQVDFVNSTVAYFITLSAFGMTEYGGREVAQLRTSPEKVSILLSKLFHLSLAISFALFLVYLGLIVPFFGNGNKLFIYSSFLILTTSFNFVWALEALEDFVFLAWAKVITKTFFVLYLVIFINNSNDTEKYFIGMMLFDFAFFLLSFIRLKKNFNSFKLFSMPDLSYVPSLFQMFIMILMQSSISGIPSLIMGKMKLLSELGQLAVAQRFFWIGYYAIIPLSTVLLSRSMGYTPDCDSTERKKHLDMTAVSIFTFCLPITVGILSIAQDVVPLLVGSKYHESINLLKFLAVLITIYSVNNFWSMQVVFSFKGDKALIKSNAFGLLMMIVWSFLLIPKYHAKGAVAAIILTYSCLFGVFYYHGKKYYNMGSIRPDLIKAFAASVIMYFSICNFSASNFYILALKVVVGATSYFLALLLLRHKLVLSTLKVIFQNK